MRYPLSDLRNPSMRHVTLFLLDGSVCKGIVPPVFWVVEGTRKSTYPEDGAKTLPIIRETFYERIRPLFDSG